MSDYVEKKCGYCRKKIGMVELRPGDPDKPVWGICGDCGDELTRLDSQPGDNPLYSQKPLTGRDFSKAIIVWTFLTTWIIFGFFLMVFGAIALYQKYHHV